MEIRDMKNKSNLYDNKKKWNWLKVVGIGVIATFVLLAGLFIAFLYDFFFKDEIPQFTSVRNEHAAPQTKVNILIIGYDSEINGSPRSDTLMLASFDLEEKAVGIMSIPRDTRVEIPGKSGYHKVNSAFANGGSELAVTAISNLLGVPIDFYVATNFDGFAQMIDTLGGVEIIVNEDMYHVDKAAGFVIDLKEGKQVLDGNKALQYVRYREPIKADLGRIERQQEFIHAALDQFLTPELVLKTPKLISQLSSSIKTNMDFKQMVSLAKVVKDIRPNDIQSARLPGESYYDDSHPEAKAWYFKHDEMKTKKLVQEMIASKEFVANSKYSVAVFNGNGVYGMAREAKKALEFHGFNVGLTANANRYNYEKTLVVYTNEVTDEIESLAKMADGDLVPFAESPYAGQEHYEKFDILLIVGKNFSEEF